eukprot:IDg2152t1
MAASNTGLCTMVALAVTLLVVSENLSMTASNISRTSHRVVDSSCKFFVTDSRSLNCCMSTAKRRVSTQ